MHLVGFPLWDSGSTALPADAREFLAAGAPPVVFTPGSAGATMHRYFKESVEAVRALGVRAMLVTNYPEQVPADLPPGVKTFGYLPFSGLLPHAAMLVYHGGIGTLAQTIKAGIPHLVVPNGHDQFDNALPHRTARAGTRPSPEPISGRPRGRGDPRHSRELRRARALPRLRLARRRGRGRHPRVRVDRGAGETAGLRSVRL